MKYKISSIFLAFIFCFVSVLAVTSCNSSKNPEPINEVETGTDEVNSQELLTIPDTAFLPPLGDSIEFTGDFDDSVEVTIEIFVLDSNQAVSPPVGPTLSTVDGSITVSYDPSVEEQYHANWDITDSNQDDGTLVRVELRLGNAPIDAPACNAGANVNAGCIAYFDVQLWKSQGQVKKDGGDQDDIIDLNNGQNLPIKFHIKDGAANVPPSVVVTSPEDGSTFTPTEDITFTATANDLEDGNLSALVSWSSDVAGDLGTGATITTSLAVGTHVVTASVTDSNGSSTQETLTVIVMADAQWQEVTLGNGTGSNTYDPQTNTFTINLENPDSEPTSYLLYQTLQGQDPLHLEACFGPELPDNAEVGLVLFQGLDNGALQTPWVKVVRTGFGARVTAEDTDGSTFIAFGSLNDPLCFRISKSGNTVYVYESVEAPTTQSLSTTSLGEPDSLITTLDLNFDPNTPPLGALNTTSNELTSPPIVISANPIVVGNAPVGSVIPNISASTDFGDAPLTVDFDASASEGSNLTYEWHFGDEAAPDTISATGVTTSHTYTAEGDYTAVLTATDDLGTSQQAEVIIFIYDFPPPPDPNTEELVTEVDLGVDLPFGFAPFEVNPSAYGSQGTGLTYDWNFGDGTVITGDETAYVNHVYETPGTYTFSLTITNSVGRTETFQQEVTIAPEIDNVIPQVDDRRAIKFTTPADLTVDFDLGDPISGFTYELDFGDGNTGTGSQASHTYDGLGTYTIKIKVQDENPGADPDAVLEEDFWFTVWTIPPEASFTMTNLNESAVPEYNHNFLGDIPLNMSFDASASTGTGDLMYQWDFGDGGTSTDQQANHTYSNEGFYLVTLTVTDESTELTDVSQAFVQATNYYLAHQPTINFRYPALSTQSLDFPVEENIAPAAVFETLNAQYPYVVYLNPAETPLNFGDIGFLVRHAGFQCSASNPASSYAVFVNGGTSLSSNSYFTTRDSSTGLCSLMLFPASFAPTLGGLISTTPEAEIKVVTSLQNFNYQIDNIAGIRVPRVYVSIVPDSMIQGNIASPYLQEYTVTAAGEEELMMLVSIRESEATGFAEFEVPIYAVDKQGRFTSEANGYFHASFTNATSDCGDCVMVNGRSSIKVNVPLNVAVGEEARFELDEISISRDGACDTQSLPSNLKVKYRLNSCVTIDTSYELPLNPPVMEPFQYELGTETLTDANSVTLGLRPGDLDDMWNWFNDLDAIDVVNITTAFIPFWHDGATLLEQIQNGINGEEVNWTAVKHATAGLLLDGVTGGLAEVAGVFKVTHQVSSLAFASGGRKILAEIIDDATDASLATKRSPASLIDDVKTREPELFDLITTACPRTSQLGTSSLSTQNINTTFGLSKGCLTGINNISDKLISDIPKGEALTLVTDNVIDLSAVHALTEIQTEVLVTRVSKQMDKLSTLNFASMSDQGIAFEQIMKATDESMKLGIQNIDDTIDLASFRHRTCSPGGACPDIVYGRNQQGEVIHGEIRYANNHREHLKRCTGINPDSTKWEAHHVFPEIFFDFYDDKAYKNLIDNNKAKYMVWWENGPKSTGGHTGFKEEYNDLWIGWLNANIDLNNPSTYPSVSTLEAQAKEFMEDMEVRINQESGRDIKFDLDFDNKCK